jgi:hypothetical protein
MLKRFSNITFITLCVLLFATSCNEKKCSDPVPHIEFESFEAFGDTSAQLTIYFKDCDGDIGLLQEDTVSPYDYNLFLEYFEKRNGVWTHIEPLFPFYYRIPDIQEATPYDLKEGQIILDMGIYFDFTSDYDTIRYEIMLKDRGQNESNTITTDEVIVS